jgi:hypothetical protein
MNRRVLLLGLASLLGTVSAMVQAQERERIPIVGVLTASAGAGYRAWQSSGTHTGRQARSPMGAHTHYG